MDGACCVPVASRAARSRSSSPTSHAFSSSGSHFEAEPFELEQRARHRPADHHRERDRRHEQRDRFPAIRSAEPMAEINDHRREESRFRRADEEA
jgi:hypothetical protein